MSARIYTWIFLSVFYHMLIFISIFRLLCFNIAIIIILQCLYVILQFFILFYNLRKYSHLMPRRMLMISLNAVRVVLRRREGGLRKRRNVSCEKIHGIARGCINSIGWQKSHDISANINGHVGSPTVGGVTLLRVYTGSASNNVSKAREFLYRDFLRERARAPQTHHLHPVCHVIFSYPSPRVRAEVCKVHAVRRIPDAGSSPIGNVMTDSAKRLAQIKKEGRRLVPSG